MNANEITDLQETMKRLQVVKNRTNSSAGLRAVARAIKYIEDLLRKATLKEDL